MKRIFLHQKQAFTESLLHTTNKATANTLLGCNWNKTLMILLMLYSIQGLYAINFTVGGIKYNTTGTTTVEVISNNYSGSIVIPSSVTNSSVTYSVTSIGNLAFYSCSSMTSISLPSSVTTIGDNAFSGCTGLTSFNIPSTVTSIGSYAFTDCRSLISIVIPPSVTKINTSTFGSCYSLSSITIPSSVTSIGEFVFYNCNQLTSITIPPSVTSIGTWAFSYCSGLTNFSISQSVTYIGSAAFAYCSAIITVDKNNPNYSSLNGLLYNKKQTKLISCPFVTSGSFIIPSSVDSIAEYAFYSCYKLTSVIIPSTVKSIGSSAFKYCTALTNITIPSSVNSIESEAFTDCSGLISVETNNFNYSSLNGLLYNKKQTKLISCPYVTSGSFIIPSSVDSIAEYALFDCSNLTSLKVPSSVKSIGNSAFENCTGLTSLYSYLVIPVNLSNSYNVFNGIKTANCILYVPIGTKSLYQAAAKWQDFINIVEFDPTSIKSVTAQSLGVYPSVFSDGFRIKGISDQAMLSIYDLNGQLLLTKTIIGNEYVSASGLPKGTYIAKVQVGRTSTNHKIVKL